MSKSVAPMGLQIHKGKCTLRKITRKPIDGTTAQSRARSKASQPAH